MNEHRIYAEELLDLCNTSYCVSNKGKEIRFESVLQHGTVTLYPTTGTYKRGDNTKLGSKYSDVQALIKHCIRVHLRSNI